VRFAFIDRERQRYPLGLLCRVLGVSRAGYYVWRQRAETPQPDKDATLRVAIRAIFREHKGRYGSPRVWDDLREDGWQISRKRVERLMREMGLVARPKRKFVTTTMSEHAFERFYNRLNRNFTTCAANEVWAADITYIPTRDGWLYLAVVIDLFSRRVVGWAMSSTIDVALTTNALTMALAGRPAPGLHHSDQGAQYAATSYQALLRAHGIQTSMSRRGNCWDNAPVESFFSTLKTELALDRHASKEKSKTQVFEYIEAYYNRCRKHSSIGNVPPVAFERMAA